MIFASLMIWVNCRVFRQHEFVGTSRQGVLRCRLCCLEIKMED